MNIVNTLTDIMSFIQKSDNIGMVQKVIDIQSQIINMQEKITKLQEENKKLKNIKNIKKNIVRHENDNVIHLKENDKILYCSKCWDDEQKLIQVATTTNNYECPKCNQKNIFLVKKPHIMRKGMGRKSYLFNLIIKYK